MAIDPTWLSGSLKLMVSGLTPLGGLIGRIAAKLQAEKWDKHREEVEQKVKDRRELFE